MAEAQREKLVVIATHGGEDPERASLPFVVGNAALAMDARVTVVLQSDAVTVGTRSFIAHIPAPGFDPIEKLVTSFLSLGGTILACIPCLEYRKIPIDLLVAGVQPAKAGRVVDELLGATSTVSY